jgi:hypothetical protein
VKSGWGAWASPWRIEQAAKRRLFGDDEVFGYEMDGSAAVGKRDGKSRHTMHAQCSDAELDDHALAGTVSKRDAK